jgi:transcription initiation factor TFIIH subunit 3
MTAGALTLALSHTSKLLATGPTSTQTAQTSFNYSDPNSNASSDTRAAGGVPGSSTSRILILSASPDNSAQYIPTMNAIFAAQRLSIPIDVLTLASSSTFLQQAADATGGIHLARTDPASHAGFLQTLMLAFLPDPTARQNLILPSQAQGGGVDFRAACFCHRRIVDVGFVCSICLSIFCEPVPEGTCLTCGSHLALASYGRKPAVVPRKKKKKKRVAEGGVETPGSAGGTPQPA